MMICEKTDNSRENIVRFLSLPEPWNYDLIDDVMQGVYYSVIKEWDNVRSGGVADAAQRYRIYQQHKKAFIELDPDSSSQLLQDIYKALWKDIESREYMTKNGRIKSDTMTSVSRIIKKAMKLHDAILIGCGDDALFYGGQDANYSIKLFMDTYAVAEEKVRDFTGEYHIDKLLAAYHTIGNFAPVPEGFNGARSNGGYYDLWDITLEMIYQYYHPNKQTVNDPIGELLRISGDNDKKDIRDRCEAWLDFYNKENELGADGDREKAWRSFVTENVFDCYVDKKDPHWRVKPFSNSDILGNPIVKYSEIKFPKAGDTEGVKKFEKIKEELIKAIDEIKSRIYKRGEQIVKELRNWVNEIEQTKTAEKNQEVSHEVLPGDNL